MMLQDRIDRARSQLVAFLLIALVGTLVSLGVVIDAAGQTFAALK